MKHRKTKVVIDSWIELDDWYMGPPPARKVRVGWDEPLNKAWSAVLAHACKDGSVRAPTSLQIYTRKKKMGLGIYGRCSGCKAPINEKVKQMISLLEIV
jgi:hypothetical protein